MKGYLYVATGKPTIILDIERKEFSYRENGGTTVISLNTLSQLESAMDNLENIYGQPITIGEENEEEQHPTSQRTDCRENQRSAHHSYTH